MTEYRSPEYRSRGQARSRGDEPGPRAVGRRRAREGIAGAVVAVGITGGIGAGKSTALAMFRQLGALTISADEVVHMLYARPEYRAQVAARFGPDVLDGQGGVDRSVLAKRVGGDAGALRWLEHLVHPGVAEEIERSIREAPRGSVVVCEVPLLFESGAERLFDLIVTVEAGRQNRRGRSTHRFGTALFSRLEELQFSSEERMAGSDLAYRNDGDVEQLREFVRGAYGQALELLREKR